ncbi:swi5 [Acrasis kona]|uniref:Swi5 n=1 Tax=Acrasis kona TaxID=1008807 RepID=A0AAW2YSG7_9EUKA
MNQILNGSSMSSRESSCGLILKNKLQTRANLEKIYPFYKSNASQPKFNIKIESSSSSEQEEEENKFVIDRNKRPTKKTKKLHEMNKSIKNENHNDDDDLKLKRKSNQKEWNVRKKIKLSKDEKIIKFKNPLSGDDDIEIGRDLKKQLNDLEDQIKKVTMKQEKVDREKLLHRELLHEYNEIKDVGQMLLGRLAEMEGVTTRVMYEKYQLDFED